MYSADELNLVRMPDEIPKYQLQEPRTINAYIGLGGKLLLLGSVGSLSHLYFAEAAARAAGGIYIQSVECWLKECEALEKLPDEQAFYKRYGALKRILKADECMLLSDDPFVRSAYLKFQKTLRKVSLRFFDFQRK